MVCLEAINNHKAVVIYCRVSTERQNSSQLGLSAQLIECNKLVESQSLDVAGIYKECVSGKIHPMNRPMLRTAINSAIDIGAALLVAKLDRFSRDTFHITSFLDGYMVEHCPRLIVAENPNASELELNVMAALAQEECRLISERTKAALSVKRSQGAELGAVGRSISVSRKRQKTQEAFNLMLDLHQKGITYQAIADRLNDQGYTTSRGGQWDRSVIYRRIKNWRKDAYD
jgi:DNA invertase Pin-like site-specific DNA recombinase